LNQCYMYMCSIHSLRHAKIENESQNMKDVGLLNKTVNSGDKDT